MVVVEKLHNRKLNKDGKLNKYGKTNKDGKIKQLYKNRKIRRVKI